LGSLSRERIRVRTLAPVRSAALTGLSANVRREKKDKQRLGREDCFESFLLIRETKVTNVYKP